MKHLLLSLAVCLYFLALSSAQEIRVGTIVNGLNPFFLSKDLPILSGVELWARWTNENGGVFLDGTAYNITVITRYIADGNDTEPNIRNATRLLIEEDLVDWMIPMFSTARVAWSYAESQLINPNLLMCGVGSSIDTPVFKPQGNNYYSTSRGISKIVTPLANLMIQLNQENTYSILIPSESAFYTTLAGLANSSLHADPETQVLFYEEYESDREDVDVDLLSQSLSALREENAAVFWFANNFGDDVAIMNLVMDAQDYLPKAALVGASIESFTREFFNQANFWISVAPYHPDLQIGTSGIHMGTMSDYADYHNEVYGRYPDISWTFIATACGVLLQTVVEATDRESMDWRNASDVATASKTLNGTSDPLAQTFYSAIKLDSTESNVLSLYYTVQMVDGTMKLITSPGDVIYPAPWPWGAEDSSDEDLGTTIGIIVGCIVGFVIIMLIVGAIVAVVLYLVKMKFYHMIVLPKGNPDL